MVFRVVVFCVLLGLSGFAHSQQYSLEDYVRVCETSGDDVLAGAGCFMVGTVYDNGEGVKQDKTKAREYYTKACELESATGCFNLGSMYYNGEGVKQDKSRAKEFYGKACDLGGFQLGCDNYRVLNEQGVR